MSAHFEELDYRPTPLGALSLRRRHEPKVGRDLFEIKLGDEYLMSSLFTASEEALARLALADLDGSGFDVVVGGLGLGYTARAVLENTNVDSLVVVELLDAVAEWHEQGLLPLGPELTGDPRCRFVRGDFFALAATGKGFVAEHRGRRYDAVLVDIDHAPDFWLAEENGTFYSAEGLRKIAAVLRPGGVFGLWSNDKPDDDFVSLLSSVFEKARAEPVTFPNQLQDNREATQTVYLAQTVSDE
ncbi:MAG: spermidine synthase [Parvibaculum sp.]|uniref:spermidine synthase n=1 Tax=Parvibaculum sp. TaxID=2024848 RepID=UPI0035B907F7